MCVCRCRVRGCVVLCPRLVVVTVVCCCPPPVPLSPCPCPVLCCCGGVREGEEGFHPWWMRPLLPLSCLVCLRRCLTLPHPIGCSTISTVWLSFQVRNGYWAFPARYDHRKVLFNTGPSALRSHTPLLLGGVCFGGLVVNRIVVDEQHPLLQQEGGLSCLNLFVCFAGTHTDTRQCCVMRVCSFHCFGVGRLVLVCSQPLTGLPRLAYQPGVLPGASHPPKGGLETSSWSKLPA